MSSAPANWKQLENDLRLWLCTFESHGLKFRRQLVGSAGFMSDGILSASSAMVAVEVEAGQKHPANNVGKYWFAQAELGLGMKRIVLFHVYTPAYRGSPGRKELGEFYWRKMRREVPIEYVPLDKRQATNYDDTLAELKAVIGEKIRKEFGVKP